MAFCDVCEQEVNDVSMMHSVSNVEIGVCEECYVKMCEDWASDNPTFMYDFASGGDIKKF